MASLLGPDGSPVKLPALRGASRTLAAGYAGASVTDPDLAQCRFVVRVGGPLHRITHYRSDILLPATRRLSAYCFASRAVLSLILDAKGARNPAAVDGQGGASSAC